MRALIATVIALAGSVLTTTPAVWASPPVAEAPEAPPAADSSALPDSPAADPARIDTTRPPRHDEGPLARERARVELPAQPVTKKARMLVAKHEARSADPENARARKKRWQARLDRRLGKPAGPVVNIYNTWTHEFFPVDAGPQAGTKAGPGAAKKSAPAVSADQVNRFLRCHFTNEPADMDPRLFTTLVAAARHFGVDRIDIISGFRSPKYNLILRKKGREVARRSQHTLGHAVDFRLPGVGTKRLHAWARRQRLGGVGFYPSSGFIHIDVGPVRYWGGR